LQRQRRSAAINARILPETTMRHILISCACACSLLLVCASVAAQSRGVYTWKDDKGVTHYSDTPPPNRHFGTVAPDPQPRVETPPKPDQRCTLARANIERLKGTTTDLGIDANGDGKPDAILDAPQRQRQLGVAEDQAKRFCKDAGTP
jgi:hypothetical protein